MTAILLKGISHVFASLPRTLALKCGRGLGILLGSVVRFRRGTVIDSLTLSFPDKSRSEIGTIASAMYRNLGMNIVEAARVSVKGLDDLDGHVDTHGVENLPDKVLAGQQGLLGLMGHIGNWELCGWLTRVIPKPITVVVKPMGTRGIEDYVSATRARMNLRILHFREAYRGSLRALKSHEVVAVILDQNTRRSVGVFVDFFGRPACTSPGLAILAAQTQCPLVPTYSVRKENGDHEVHILPALPPPPDRKQETLQEATQRYTKVLEDIIRKHPEQWLWIHRRWKTPPETHDDGSVT